MIPELRTIGEKYGKSAAQVALRWMIQLGVVVIPKSVSPKRIAENTDVFDFTLSEEEMEVIETLDQGRRLGPDTDNFAF